MGLDISAYSQVTYEQPYDPEGDWDYDRLTHLYNDDFPERRDGLEEGLYRVDGARFDFCAGSYHGYTNWRAWLCKMAVEVDIDVFYAHPDRYREAPFYALIMYSDCEGFIGPVTSRILAADFQRFAEHAISEAPDECYARVYNDFARAFALASGGGAVRFH